MNQLPQPQPCHNCSHSYAGAICPICKEERPSYSMLKKLAKEEAEKDKERRFVPEAI